MIFKKGDTVEAIRDRYNVKKGERYTVIQDGNVAWFKPKTGGEDWWGEATFKVVEPQGEKAMSKLVTGMKVRVKIFDDIIEDAKVYVETPSRIFICQNERDGSNAPDKLGYKYSWVINGGNVENPQSFVGLADVKMIEIIEGFKNGDIITDDTDKEFFFVGYDQNHNVIALDKYDGSYDMRREELGEFYGEIKLVSDKHEFTLKEVADKMGVPLDKLRIKDN